MNTLMGSLALSGVDLHCTAVYYPSAVSIVLLHEQTFRISSNYAYYSV